MPFNFSPDVTTLREKEKEQMESHEVEKKRVTFSRLSFLSKPVVSSFFVSPTLTLSKDHVRRSLITGSGKDRQRQLCVWVTRGYLRKKEEERRRERRFSGCKPG